MNDDDEGMMMIIIGGAAAILCYNYLQMLEEEEKIQDERNVRRLLFPAPGPPPKNYKYKPVTDFEPYNGHRFSIDDISDRKALKVFRMNKEQFRYLADTLFAKVQRYGSKNKATNQEMLGVVLYKLATGSTNKSMKTFFSHSESWITNTFNAGIMALHAAVEERLFLDKQIFTREYIERLADKVEKDKTYRAWGFTDCTVRQISRPSEHMFDPQTAYNARKKVHAVKFQGVVAANGLMAHISSAYPGNCHDSRILKDSRLREKIMEHLGHDNPSASDTAVYGDSAYHWCGGCVVGAHKAFINRPLTPQQEEENKLRSEDRIVIEWAFFEICQRFKFLDKVSNMMMGRGMVSMYYPVAVFLYNITICQKGHSKISDKFGIDPPTVEEYLANFQPIELTLEQA